MTMNKMIILFFVLTLAFLCFGSLIYAANKPDTTNVENKVDKPDSLIQKEIKTLQAVKASLEKDVESLKADVSQMRFLFSISACGILILLLLLVLAFMKIADKASKKRLSHCYDELNGRIEKLEWDNAQPNPTVSKQPKQESISDVVDLSKSTFDKRNGLLLVTFIGQNNRYNISVDGKDKKRYVQGQVSLEDLIRKYFSNRIAQERSRRARITVPTNKPDDYNNPQNRTQPHNNGNVDSPSGASPQQETQNPERKSIIKELYMANNEDDIFTKSSDHKLEESTFLIEYDPEKSETQGDLNVIASINDLRVMNEGSRQKSIKVNRFENCTWKDATEYEQVHVGKVIKNQNVWVIINPVEIILKK